MYSLPSTSKMCEPCPCAMNSGLPPTLRKARTGELTPPGINSCARWKKASDLVVDFINSVTVRERKEPAESRLQPGLAAPLSHQPAQSEIHAEIEDAAIQIFQ